MYLSYGKKLQESKGYYLLIAIIYCRLQEVFGGTDRDVEKQDLSRLVYMEAVLKETMRYYVMAPFVGRYLTQDVKLSNPHYY